jgi:predicted transcriptional regulator
MAEWRELTWDEAMQRGYDALRSGEAIYQEIDAEQGRSNIDIEKHLRRAELGYAPFTSLAEAGQVLRRTSTDTCASWNPWETNYPHQGPKKETTKESNSSAQP